MKIALASEADLEDIAVLLHELKTHYWGAQSHSPETVRRYVEENFFHPHCGVSVALARLDEWVVGIATFSILYPGPDGGGQLYLKDLYTSAQARGQGVGLALMKYLANFAISHGCRRFDWTAETDNPDAIAFYEKSCQEKI